MSSEQYKIGRKVKVSGKDVEGTIAFVGTTSFAQDTWIGLKLDEPKGRNDGSVQGVVYFTCEDKYGLFVKPSQVVLLDDSGKPVEEPAKVRARPSTSRLSLASSRQSLASSRQSLSGSRHSLAGSRQSLMGSRSQLASPVVERPEESSSQIPKRASFVETGFVETLKPQFTPGQAITSATPTPISSVEEKINLIQMQQEVENRNQQIKDLSEKLETLRIKRSEDKEKLKEFDKLKIQLDQLLEFKAKIMEAQSSLQRDLQRAKQELKDAMQEKESRADEMSDLSEAMEMATLDKEMAEEKAETLQMELEMCKEKLEEVKLDLKILKTEMQGRSGGGETTEEISAYEFKQLQQQNARLRETLVRLRDLAAHDKHEQQKLLKDIDQKKSEIVELGKTKEKLSARVEEMEQQIVDLQEQVDAALGAEEMVVLLGEQKLTLEEKVARLEEEVADLEALQDMNDQLVESNAELEAELREDLDLAQAQTRQALRDRDAALETVADREATIGKFRELVQKLQEQSLELQHRLEEESTRPVSSSAMPEMLDFKKMFSETKAHTKAIDLELRRLDVQQLQQQIKYLTSYMPDSFMNRGGDHDAILALLLVPRMVQKSDILLNQIKDKFVKVEKIDRGAVLKGHGVEQFSFRCRVSFYVYALQTILRQYLFALGSCRTEALLKVGAVYPEMASQERVIDGYVELVKRDQLDENVLTEALEKCVTYFNTLYPVLLGNENRSNHTELVGDSVKCLLSACEGMGNDSLAIISLIEGGSVGDIGNLAQYVVATGEQLQQQLKLVKRRLPTDPNVANIGLSKEIHENLYQCYQHAMKVMKTLQDIVRNSAQAIVSSGEMDKGLSRDKIKDVAMNASDRIYEQDDLGPVQSVKNSLTFITTQIGQLAQFLQDNEFEINTAKSKEDQRPPPPIQMRAETVKKELEQTKTLTSKLEDKESDVKELRKALKEKQELLSEMTIRKELAEKKLGNVNKDYELTIEKLQRKLEEAHNAYRKKEKEFEETLDHLQQDIDSLENEKGEMKEKVKMLSKKTQMELNRSVTASGQQPQSLSQTSLGPNITTAVKDSPWLLHEIECLRHLYKKERDERNKLEIDRCKQVLESLAPLPSFKKDKDEVIDQLLKEGESLKMEILLYLATRKIPNSVGETGDKRAANWEKYKMQERAKVLQYRQRAQFFMDKVTAEYVKRKRGGRVEADFAIFPTPELTKALKESQSVNIGFVKIPVKSLPGDEKPHTVKLELDYQSLQTVLSTLSEMHFT